MAIKTRDEAVILAGLVNMVEYYAEDRFSWYELEEVWTKAKGQHSKLVPLIQALLERHK